MALLARQNVIAKPGMRSCAMPRIAPATHMQRILVKATGEVMVCFVVYAIQSSFLVRVLTADLSAGGHQNGRSRAIWRDV